MVAGSAVSASALAADLAARAAGAVPAVSVV